ncbi:ribosomal RNA processing protein 1 homolog A isoform X2 [Cloeon dipterum]|uniref:ribosomal RNA processing protein 1 homolog A isoform X2 n=1 Tax=Cloeon dipterum TaxID=197152 RepID=UPI00322087A5
MVKCKNINQTKDVEEKKRVLQISEEIALVQKLADNEVHMRDRALKRLKRWIYGKTKDGPAFTKEDLMMLWRGLFYCMWNSDKPLVQEQLCEDMGSLVHCILNDKDVMLFIDGFLSTLRYEWTYIDNYRMDKYKMLVRRVLRQILVRVSSDDWKLAGELGKLLWENILNFKTVPPPPIGLAFHISEIYFQEISKCSGKNELTENALLDFVRPFVQCIASNKTDERLQAIIRESVFGYLVNQSDVGIEQDEKIQAWKMMGCPAINLDQIEKNEIDSEDDEEMIAADSDDGADDEEQILDPRAGQMNVELPQIKFNSKKIADMVDEFLADKKLNSKTKKSLKLVREMFQLLAQNIHPIPFEAPVKEDEIGYLGFKPRKSAKRAAENLMKFEEELMKESAKARRKRKGGFEPYEELDVDIDNEEESQPLVEQPQTKPSKKAPSPKADEPPAKRRRRSSLGLISNWEISEVTQEVAKEKVPDASSPGNIGNWNVVSVSEQDSTPKKGVSSEWEKPLQEGEYEYFVSPKKSPRRRSLCKASIDQEVAAEEPKPEMPENQESPKSSRVAQREEPKNFGSPLSALRKARVSMPLNTKSQDLTPVGKKSLLIPALTNSAKKRVSIKLEHNKAQEVHEYVKQLRESPRNPHDSSKKPSQGLLKGSPAPFKSAIAKFRQNNMDIL